MPLTSLIPHQHLEEMRSLALSAPPGNFVEVGVYKGGSAQVLYDAAGDGRKVFLFDTFTGIPHKDERDEVPVGEFSDVDEDEIRRAMPRAVLVKGVFPETLGEVVNELSLIALLHVDADQYRVTRDVIELLMPLMAKGGVAIFDDVNALRGVKEAVEEAFGNAEVKEGTGRYKVFA